MQNIGGGGGSIVGYPDMFRERRVWKYGRKLGVNEFALFNLILEDGKGNNLSQKRNKRNKLIFQIYYSLLNAIDRRVHYFIAWLYSC